MIRNLTTSIQYLKGVGPKRARTLEKLGILTIEDMLYYFPRRYQDRTKFTPIKDLKKGDPAAVKARILACGGRQSFRRRGFSIVEAVVEDKTGRVSCVWFNQPYVKEYLKAGKALIIYGKLDSYGGRLQFSSPEFEIISKEIEDSLDTGGVIPVYSLAETFTQRYFRELVRSVLNEYITQIQDFLPFSIRARVQLLNLAKALLNIHFPESLQAQQEAYRRLSFEEFFIFQLPLALRKLKKAQKKGISHKVEGELVESFLKGLPFSLTSSQEKVIQEIKLDMQRPHPMQRLLQGDVGSGKTVVAIYACLVAIQGGYQAVFMVPTEILARQHYENIKYEKKNIEIALLTGSSGRKDKSRLSQRIREGKINLIIGTHALLNSEVAFKNLGLVVIDEQHKFGVGQRALLSGKGSAPDVLIMTATPIPRTLAITLYGDLDISVINQMPPGRLPVKTMHFQQDESLKAYALATEELVKGRQVFIVYPVIEESYALDIAGAKKMFERLQSQEFKDFRMGLIHGRLKDARQREAMLKFRNKDLDILVSTTVLEVGIDIPDATCMIIEHAERFGLAQLHQLRGRVGRGNFESCCLLISDARTPDSQARLQAMTQYGDGFTIAEEDLKIRGPGEFFGRRQHGLTELKIANPLTQMRLLKLAREEALKTLNLDPCLESRANILLKAKLLQRFPEYEDLILTA